MNAERGVHHTALTLIRGGCERTVHPLAGTEQIVQYRQVMSKRQHLQIIHIGRYELTERFVRSVDEVTKRDGIYIIKGYREIRYPCSASAQYQQPTFVQSDEWISTESCGMIVGQEVTVAMKLQDLYYGNVIPCQHDVRKDSDFAKRSLELLEMCDKLEKRLSSDDKKLLNDITDMQGMLSETMVAESYIQGFRDCTELIIDVMFGSSENLK